jgi:hypothetical protein
MVDKYYSTPRAYWVDSGTRARMVESEGLVIKDNQIDCFEDIFWDPIKELEL